MAAVHLTSDAWEDYYELDGDTRSKVRKGLLKLETEPAKRGQPLGSQHTGNLTTFRKLVVGNRDYRIVYRIDEDGTAVVVWVIGRRTDAECYQLAMARFSMHENPLVRRLAEEMGRFWRED